MAAGQGLQPRAAVVKPAHTVLEAYHRTDVIQVKFRDDAPVRLRGGALTDLGTGVLDEARDVLAALTGVTWQPLIAAAEPDLEDLRQAAQRNLGRGVADFRVWFRAFLPPHLGAEEAIDALNGLECVELAEPVQEAAPLPIPPLFANEQPYLNAGPVGAGAYPTWEHLGIRGINVNVVDIEFGWEIFHQDLPTVNLIQAGDPPLTQAEEDHGTATLGVLGALDNNFGTTGMAPQATLGFAAARVGGVVNIPPAITTSALNTQPGDIILIELQIAGPAACGTPCSPLGLPPCDCSAGTAWVPVEWDLASYNAIVAAAGAGRIVIEPAGNGAQNLDAAIYQTGNGGHWPFLAQNDSGAIMVGAGMPPIIHGGLDLDRSRICCSNYGSRVDVQGQGWKVFSTGYGDWHAEASGQLDYTDDYAGTSSAAATIAGAAALVQSAFKWFNNSNVLSPAGMRQVLINSGSAQQSAVNNSFPATQNIGPRPDASIAILLAVGGCLPLYDTTVGNPGLPDNVIDLLSFNDGSGNKLFASGRFEMTPPNGHVAEWDGTSWSSVGVDPFVGNFVNALEVYDDGSGPQLYAGGGGGSFGGVSVWDGSAWTKIGDMDGWVLALEVFNGELYAGGRFSNVLAGGPAASRIARWNGTSWSAVGSGMNDDVLALHVHDDGGGPDLYAGGAFTTAGGTSADRMARWNGTAWSAVGSGMNDGDVRALGSFDDGGGMKLYAGGTFTTPSNPSHIAAWDGAQWATVGPGTTQDGVFSNVFDMTTFDDGTGEALFIAGAFRDVTGAWSRGVTKWDGTRYWPLGDGVSGDAEAIVVHDDGTGPALYAGGAFQAAWDLLASRVVEWGGCSPPPCPGDTDGNGSVSVTDFLALLAAWGPNYGHPADLNNDGVVNVIDFLGLIANWGPCP
jgi:hypothetical protein